MAYLTGSAASAPALLDLFRSFAQDQGWTINRNVVAGSGRELCISKGASFFNFRAYNNETMVVNGISANGKSGISVNGSDGYGAGNAWDQQPGYPRRTSASGGDQGHAMMPLVLSPGPFPTYHFFAPDSKTLFCELECVSGVFLRFGCGALDLFNPSAPGGGRFFYATGGSHVTNSSSNSLWLGGAMDSPNTALEVVPFRLADYASSDGGGGLSGSMVRVASGSFDNWAGSARSGGGLYQAMCCQGGGCHDKVLRDYSPDPMNGIGLLLPNVVALNLGNEFLSPIGVVPGMRYMDMTGYQPGEEFNLGSDVWKVFPWYQKGGMSAQRGIAYKKVA